MHRLLILAFCGILMAVEAKSQSLTNRVEIAPGLFFEVFGHHAAVDTNGRNVGTNRFVSDEEIQYMITTTRTPGVSFGFLPPGQKFEFELFDELGKPVAKSETGIKNSADVDLAKTSAELKVKLTSIAPGEGRANAVFIPDQYFNITKRGIYKLKVQIRVWAQMSNGNYGIVASPPVRVQVEKK